MNHPTHRLTTTLLTPLLLATLLLTACNGDSDTPDPTATPSPTPTATSTPTSTTTPSPEGDPNLPPGLAPSPPDTWQRLDLAPGDAVPDVLGAFIADPTTGAGTLWSLNLVTPDIGQPIRHTVSPNAGYVIAGASLVDTASGQSFSWDERLHFVEMNDSGTALFVAQKGPCRIWAVNLAAPQPVLLATLTAVEVQACLVEANFSPDGSELLTILEPSRAGELPRAYLIDLTTGTPELLNLVEPSLPRDLRFNERASDDETAHLTASLPGAIWSARYHWATHIFTTSTIEIVATPRGSNDRPTQPDHLRFSPDGRWLAWSDTADLGVGRGLGGYDEWPVVVITSIEHAAPVVRAQRLALTNGIVTFDWLPDSSALVVQHEQGFALLSPDGSIEDLPFPVAFHNNPVPLPAPDGTARSLFDGQMMDSSGQPLGQLPPVVDAWAGAPETQTPTHSWWFGASYRWNSTGDRSLFVRAEVGGKDFGRGGVATLGLPPHITTGPDAATPGPIHLRVASDGDNLNVRSAPGLAAERIGQFPHGTLITLTRDPASERCDSRGCSILNDLDPTSDNPWWLYVRDEAGTLEGWVTSEFVEWAD